VGSGTITISSADVTMTVSGTTGGEIDVPLLGVPCGLALYARVEGSVSVEASVEVKVQNLQVALTGGFANGQLFGPFGASESGFSITCDGLPLNSTNASNCVSVVPSFDVAGSLSVALWAQVGPDQANVGIGPEITFSGSVGTSGVTPLSACFTVSASANLDIPNPWADIEYNPSIDIINPPDPLFGSCS
jgi:hypothetical protein